MGDISIKGKCMLGRMGQSAQETSKKKLQKSIKEKKGSGIALRGGGRAFYKGGKV